MGGCQLLRGGTPHLRPLETLSRPQTITIGLTVPLIGAILRPALHHRWNKP